MEKKIINQSIDVRIEGGNEATNMEEIIYK
jgi:hypothetical protein